ncbi:RhoGEF domain-containing protein [Candidatus Protochlamydia amoebophila]|uniref:DH domain-containing protein n=1 Tax=Protochlamydia amoebophila (strain UWE25) TaxID=264201 RepID=Q6MEF2_PARUW|nr:RhoGEF domain-containing protein [Candidatus Protochlamydia amoebophila]CAF23047.1 unnamed protein product [Candidatus Protochlamydia amoebophila UWE25]
MHPSQEVKSLNLIENVNFDRASNPTGELQGRSVSSSSTHSSPSLQQSRVKLVQEQIGDKIMPGLIRKDSNKEPVIEQISKSELENDSSPIHTRKARSDSLPIFFGSSIKKEKNIKNTPSSTCLQIIPIKKSEVEKTSPIIAIEEKNEAIASILLEIIETEQTFFGNLEKLENLREMIVHQGKFFKFLDKSELQIKQVLENLLGEAHKLKLYSEFFIQALQHKSQTKSNFQTIIGILMGLNYQTFINVPHYYNRYLSCLRKLPSNKLKEKLNDKLKEELNNHFESIAVTMVQRLPRYELFIKSLIEKTEQDLNTYQKEYTDLKKALENVQLAVSKMNQNVTYSIALPSPSSS